MASNVTRDHHTFTRDTVKNVSGDLTLDIVGDLTLDAGGGDIYLKNGGATYGQFVMNPLTTKVELDLANNKSFDVDSVHTTTSAGTYTGMLVNFGKAGSTADNTMHGLKVQATSTVMTAGENILYGIYCSPQLTHATDTGDPTIIGGYFSGVGSTYGTSTSVGVQIDQNPAWGDTTYGLQIRSAVDTDDFFAISTGAAGATTISTEDDGGATAHLTLAPDGDVISNPQSGKTTFPFVGNTADLFRIRVLENGATTLSTVDADTAVGHLTLAPDGNCIIDAEGEIILDSVSGGLGVVKFYDNGTTANYFQIDVAGQTGMTTLSTVHGAGADGHLTLAPDGDCIIDRNVGNTSAGTYTGLSIDFDKTGASTSDNTLYGLLIDADNTTATNGTNTMYGIYCTPTLAHAAGAGTQTVIGGYLKAESNANGTSKSVGLVIEQQSNWTVDTQYGLVIQDGVDTSDFFSISTGASGATTIATVDTHLTAAHLTLDTDGQIILDPADGMVNIYDNGDATEYAALRVIGGSGSLHIITASDNADGHLLIIPDGHVEFDGCAVGFDKLGILFGESPVLGNGGYSTDVDFRLGNKYELELTANMTDTDFLNLIFPTVSGNFLLVISQDGTGSQTVHADSWVAYQSDGSTKATNAAFANGTDGDLRWAGGSAPTLTTTADKADIVSIYWDADNQTAFAVISQNF